MPTSSLPLDSWLFGFLGEAQRGRHIEAKTVPQKERTAQPCIAAAIPLHDILIIAFVTKPFWGTGFDSLLGGGEREK